MATGFKVSAADQPMLDDQKTVVHATPVGNLNGKVPTWTAVPGTAVVIDASGDATGLTCAVAGRHGVAGDEVVTISVTNDDNTVGTGAVTFHMTIDPAELDVTSFDVTVDPPVAQ